MSLFYRKWWNKVRLEIYFTEKTKIRCDWGFIWLKLLEYFFFNFFIIFFIYSWLELLHFVIIVSIYIMMVNSVSHRKWKANWHRLNCNYIYIYIIYIYIYISTSYINPTWVSPQGHSLQGHSTGTHFFIFPLTIWRVSKSFISLGKISHIFGAKDDVDSMPYLTDLTLLSKKLFPRSL